MTTKKEFNNIRLKFPVNIMISGTTQSGKTTLVKKILTSYNNEFDYILIFGKNLRNYKDIPRVTIFSKVEIYLLEDLQEANDILINCGEQMKKIMVVFDDILSEKFHAENKTFWTDFLSTCRNKNISCIFSVQYIKGITPAMRKNMLYYFITDNSNLTIDNIHPFCTVPKKELRELLTDCRGYECLFISNYKTQKEMCIIKE